MATAITNVRVFDGTSVHPPTTVVLSGATIASIGAAPPAGATVVDGTNHTLLPGLIDAHVHTQPPSLALALTFGVTTELEMMGHWTPADRAAVAADDGVADVRSADFGLTAPGGHPGRMLERVPAHLRSDAGFPAPREHAHAHPHPPQGQEGQEGQRPSVSCPAEAEQFVADRVAAGADYIKFMIEEGSVLDLPGLPLMSRDTIEAGVRAAHAHGKLAVAHALTLETTTEALDLGMDCLTHVFMDGVATAEIVALFKEKGAFLTACACLNASFMGIRPKAIVDDERVTSRLPKHWLDTLDSSFDCYPDGKFEHVLASIKALHDAGVDVLVGTDASMPVPQLGGLAHGASVHHELQLFVQAGLTPVEALKAATSTTAKRFGLTDRGRVAEGMRADLLLVEGDPTTNISDTLNIRGVWRRGKKLEV